MIRSFDEIEEMPGLWPSSFPCAIYRPEPGLIDGVFG
jgi:hypothetical protein